MVLGSVGCFLVIESREHATARGAPPLAHIAAIADRSQPPAPRRGDRQRRRASSTRCAVIWSRGMPR